MRSKNKVILPFFFLCCLLFTVIACNNQSAAPEETVIVEKPQQFNTAFSDLLRSTINYISEKEGVYNDSIQFKQMALVQRVYEENNYQPVWSKNEVWLPVKSDLHQTIKNAKYSGLFPLDYHWNVLDQLTQKMETDSLAIKNVANWTKADIIYTNAWFQMAKDLKWGHLPNDSVSLKNDSLLTDDFFYESFLEALKNNTVTAALQKMEPQIRGYQQLKDAIPAFIDSVSFEPITYIWYPYKDSLKFYKQLQGRLNELGYLKATDIPADTVILKNAIIGYQKSKGLKTTGKISETMVRQLNYSNWERFKRIAVNMDRYRLLGDSLPQTHILVNLPSYTLQLIDSDTLVLQSKVIVGTPRTRTPLLNSEVVQFITYPQWTVPYSIIFKEMLPKIQSDLNYLQKQNLIVVDKNDSIINPITIDWSALSKKKFPYLLKQRQGDDNSLGVIKFNFKNKYSVYLHDTNARWLFKKSNRALSHGCVRVQEWEKLSHFLVKNDTIKYHPDTLKAWIIRQEKHIVSNFPRIALFIRYFTAEGVNGRLKFYDDIYGEDRILSERYFASKPVQ